MDFFAKVAGDDCLVRVCIAAEQRTRTCCELWDVGWILIFQYLNPERVYT